MVEREKELNVCPVLKLFELLLWDFLFQTNSIEASCSSLNALLWFVLLFRNTDFLPALIASTMKRQADSSDI